MLVSCPSRVYQPPPGTHASAVAMGTTLRPIVAALYGGDQSPCFPMGRNDPRQNTSTPSRRCPLTRATSCERYVSRVAHRDPRLNVNATSCHTRVRRSTKQDDDAAFVSFSFLSFVSFVISSLLSYAMGTDKPNES